MNEEDKNSMGGVSLQYMNNTGNDDLLGKKTRMISKTTDSIRNPGYTTDFGPPQAARIKRSMSMPFMIKSILSKPTPTFNRRTKKKHVRSKSVHFDEKLPIKLYQLDDRPRIISDENSYDTGKVNFDKIKPLGRINSQEYYEDEDEGEDINMISDSSINYGENNGFYDFNFPIFDYEQGLQDVRINYFFNHTKNDLYLQELHLEFLKHTQDWVLKGIISLRNIFFEKFVVVRYTTNNWKNSTDISGKYIRSGNNYDFFEFQINKLVDLINYDYDKHSINLEFCINYQTTDNNHQILEFWDNNNDKNYRMRLVVGKELNTITKEEEDIKNIEKQFMNWNLTYTDSNKSHNKNTKKGTNNQNNKKKSIQSLLNENSDSDSDLDSLEFDLDRRFKNNRKNNSRMTNNFGMNNNFSNFGSKKRVDNFNNNDILQSAMNQYPFKQYNFKNSFNS
ncbi:similar to Saccharomyces cerevisiae YIL045W PIG2 Putative type-1 protein phosphatase targeting subunit that tethers Glc7p type-1 protein phosphatase to Gsy2p glycogen synthase [Maudiozyma saulgeensis]|uniref:Similar to Saccharomyces cerevisiae YIL045W PIG2 Putative type-1 protein phosphatase targeting subunit that tethers Glc7p type-1 protein phosphatase to Gsy2p glycogen synthase n=1 Tax=Maudiozyma saulgeensis TaxID=1789683 RepID=A0A1X7QY14_9SACH|nr:similar to Saccharomyces cerevisiae YIL045W PIG2 Putative type-1 protein phosphatase targeting subunit that tethers Glc7p type-1 protein phosphatase to Gsy2p glycogen synthase [Kazachstania saulgeensis]